MRRQDFQFELPEEQIAHYPPQQRSDCRLLRLDGKTGQTVHGQFSDVCDLLSAGDLLVLNDTRVIPARLYGRKPTGGRVEVMLERVLPGGELLAQLRSSKKLASGARFSLLANTAEPVDDLAEMEVLGREGSFYRLRLHSEHSLERVFEQAGHMPLPPYIRRDDEALDRERYQTVYARESGAVAAPTAGLHFDQALLDSLAAQGVEISYVTLHVGAATFQPVRVDDISEHEMHGEHIHVSQACCDAILRTWQRGGRVIAVGSTCVRSLESAAASGALKPFDGDSHLFIYPGFAFQCVDAMITNFHLSESTLLMMVSAFAGKDKVLRAYNEAVEERYMFFSYGDAMFIEAARPPQLRLV